MNKYTFAIALSIAAGFARGSITEIAASGAGARANFLTECFAGMSLFARPQQRQINPSQEPKVARIRGMDGEIAKELTERELANVLAGLPIVNQKNFLEVTLTQSGRSMGLDEYTATVAFRLKFRLYRLIDRGIGRITYLSSRSYSELKFNSTLALRSGMDALGLAVAKNGFVAGMSGRIGLDDMIPEHLQRYLTTDHDAI